MAPAGRMFKGGPEHALLKAVMLVMSKAGTLEKVFRKNHFPPFSKIKEAKSDKRISERQES